MVGQLVRLGVRAILKNIRRRAAFHAAGLRTGLYTSPHLVDFRERIRVNGEPIREDCVTDLVERLTAAQG